MWLFQTTWCLEKTVYSFSKNKTERWQNSFCHILWKLAEKTALLIGEKKRQINDYVKSAYNKRSAFIHGEYKEKDKSLEKNDVYEIEGLIRTVFWKSQDLRKQGYTDVQKKDGIQSIDGYIEELKFGKE